MFLNKYLIVLILSILADVVCNNSIIQVFGVQTYIDSIWLTITMLVLQMLTAPIQAGFSDFYLRKKSLIIALSCSFISLVFLFFAKSPGLFPLIFLWLGLLINACLGNTVPISWSALADVQEKNLRFNLALTTSAYAIGYMVLAIFSKAVPQGESKSSWLWQDIFMPLSLIGLSILLVWIYYNDIKDSKSLKKWKNKKFRFSELAHSEFTSLAEEMRSHSTRYGLLAYFSWASSQYSPLLLLVLSQKYASTVIVMMFGYLAGVAILAYCKHIMDEKIIRTAYIITISSMTMYFIINPFMKDSSIVLSACCFFYTMGNAFLTPSIFSLFSKERGIHSQGKGFGLIVSADSAGFLVAVIAVRVFDSFKLELEYMILFSYIVFLLSWIPYSLYEKTRRNAPRIDKTNQ